jgi:hypothetical protein
LIIIPALDRERRLSKFLASPRIRRRSATGEDEEKGERAAAR